MADQRGLEITAEEYLVRERASTGPRCEFYGGKIVAMSGARRVHVKIVANLLMHLGNALSGKPCDVYSNDLRVDADASGKYFYPDVIVACEGARFLDDQLDTLLDPTVVIEVLSESTEAVDKSVKLDAYRSIPSVMHCVLVDSRSTGVEHHRRQGPTTWLVEILADPGAILALDAVAASVSLANIYEKAQSPR